MPVLTFTVSIEQDEPFPDDAELDDMCSMLESFAINAYSRVETATDWSLGCDWTAEDR